MVHMVFQYPPCSNSKQNDKSEQLMVRAAAKGSSTRALACWVPNTVPHAHAASKSCLCLPCCLKTVSTLLTAALYRYAA